MAQDVYSPGGSPPPRIGDWISEAFELFGKEWQTWVGQGLVYALLGLGPMAVGYAAFYISFFAAGIAAGSSSSGSSSLPPGSVGGMVFGGVAMLVGYVVGVFFSVRLMAGMKHTAAKQLRGEPITVRDVFGAGEVFWPYLGTLFLWGIVVSLGMVLCYVPGFLLAGMLMFATPLVVEKRLGPVAALQQSWEVTKPHMWLYLVYYFLIALIGGLGMYVCLFGAAATMPIFMLGVMVAYRDVIGLPGALPSTRSLVMVPPPGAAYPPGAPVPAGNCPSCRGVVYAGSVVCPHCRTPLA